MLIIKLYFSAVQMAIALVCWGLRLFWSFVNIRGICSILVYVDCADSNKNQLLLFNIPMVTFMQMKNKPHSFQLDKVWSILRCIGVASPWLFTPPYIQHQVLTIIATSFWPRSCDMDHADYVISTYLLMIWADNSMDYNSLKWLQ